MEENPGPTIFEVIDWTRTVCADYNQGNEVLLGENAGKQCVPVSLTAIIYHHIFWLLEITCTYYKIYCADK